MRNYGYENTIKSFSKISNFDFTKQLVDKIKSEIEGKAFLSFLGTYRRLERIW